jgi:hypothetical protein
MTNVPENPVPKEQQSRRTEVYQNSKYYGEATTIMKLL